MKISVGMDHAGVPLRDAVINYLKISGIEYIDHGTETKDSVDYPDYAELVAKDIQTGKADLGILMCSSGVGMSIAANKVPGVRAALVQSADLAVLSRQHNNANVLCMGAKYVSSDEAIGCVKAFLETPFEGGRHERRVCKISKIEQEFDRS